MPEELIIIIIIIIIIISQNIFFVSRIFTQSCCILVFASLIPDILPYLLQYPNLIYGILFQ